MDDDDYDDDDAYPEGYPEKYNSAIDDRVRIDAFMRWAAEDSECSLMVSALNAASNENNIFYGNVFMTRRRK